MQSMINIQQTLISIHSHTFEIVLNNMGESWLDVD